MKNSTNVFSDDFTSAPANGDGRYSVGANNIPGTLTVDTDANNRSVLVLDAAHGVSTNGIGSTTPFLVDSAIALTGTNPAGSSTLTKTDDFTVQARFDLTVPNDLNEAYGIRLTDRLPGVAVGGTTGDDVVELRVAENTAGGIQVQFRDINFQTGPLDSNNNPLGTVTTLQNIGLSTGAIQSGEQIVLTLSHDASNPNTIIASYDLYAANGTQLDANGAAAGMTQTFTVAGSLFSDENWTQAQIHASSPSVDNSYYTGTYGTLTVDPTGAWSYSLLNGSTQVQALAAGQVVQDNFEIQVKDDQGATSTQAVTVNVTGTNDAPTIAGDKSITVTRGGSVVLTTNDLRGADVDSPATDLVFTVTAETNGWVALASAPGTHITTFTEGQLEAGSVVFIEDNANPTPPALPPTSASFSVSLTDGVAGTTPATATVNATVTDAEHDLWGELQYPTIVQGEHLFGVNPQFNSQAGVIVLAYSDTFGYSAAAASHTDTRNVALLDPFFLPSEQPAQTLTNSPDTVQCPRAVQFHPAKCHPLTTREGIYIYKTQANTGRHRRQRHQSNSWSPRIRAETSPQAIRRKSLIRPNPFST